MEEPPVTVETTAASNPVVPEQPPSTEQVTVTEGVVTEQATGNVETEQTPVVQEPEPTTATQERRPVDQPQPETATPEEPVAQPPTPVVIRPQRKRRVSTTSAPGDVNLDSGSDTAGKIYHNSCHGHWLISQ